MESFRRAVQERYEVALPDYDALHAWSVARPQEFWGFLAQWCRLPMSGAAALPRSADPMPLTRWFEGAYLNYAQALLYPADLVSDEQTALIAAVESGAETSLTFAELRREVASVQRALGAAGVARGDNVVALAANVPETVILLLACAGLGARLATCSPDFGAQAALARFGQLAPTMLFASAGYAYGGRWFDTSRVIVELTAALSLPARSVVCLPYPGRGQQGPDGATPWHEWLASAAAAAADPELDQPLTLRLPFDEPLSVLFSSGTTGTPKALVHRAGGLLLTHCKEHALHCDIGPGDVVFYFTTCGWMMWNWLVSALAQGATVLLYDGSPAHPDASVLFELAQRHRVTFFGTSARFIHALHAAGSTPGLDHDLSSLRTVASTGSPLSPAGFAYAYSHIKEDVHLASISGGTDIVGCFMLGVPTLPVFAGQIQRPGLGVDLAVYDSEGLQLQGEPGELVCRQPLPSMPLQFVGDHDFTRYRASYLEHFPGVWRHGDRIEFTEQGGIVVHGRSDATLNPGGVRIGTAEIYRALEGVPEIVEAAAVGKKLAAAGAGSAADEEVWLAVVLGPGVVLDDDLRARIVAAVRRDASPRHAPKRVFQVADLPRTRSGKLMELTVARLVNGVEPGDVDAVANPASLVAIREALAAQR